MIAGKTRVTRVRGLITELLIGAPLPQRLPVPKKYRPAVTALIDHPSAKDFDVGRYLRYNLSIEQGWAIAVGDAESILDETYPWDQYGFAVNDEGHMEGPDCRIIDGNWDLLDPRGEPTNDPKAGMENWSLEDAFGDTRPRRRSSDVTIVITALSRTGGSLLEKLRGKELGWNLTQSKQNRRSKQLEIKHETYSGRALLTEPERGMLLCRIEPTDVYDPERLLALVIGALHRWCHNDAHSIDIQYVQNPTNRRTRRTSGGPQRPSGR